MTELNNPRKSPGAGEPIQPKPAAVGEQLDRILASPRFADSPRLSSFLRFVVEAKLAGEEDRIQEYTIGVEVFDRGGAFDPRLDSIVRVEARRLRDRLAEYYAVKRDDDSIVIQLPRRGYQPEFVHDGHSGASQGDRDSLDLREWLHNSKIAWGTALAALAVCGILLLQPRPKSREGVIELLLQPPRGGALLTPLRGGGPVLSPDGRRAVFVARDEKGGSSLYLRSLDRVQPARLKNTENAVWPFWAPNGGKIGFGALEKLKIFDLGRQEVQTIADAPGYRGGTWSEADGGVIVIATQRGPLLRVPPAGGTPRSLLPLQEGESGHREPTFLPDGKRVLYGSTGKGAVRYEMRVADLASGQSQRLFEADSVARFAQIEHGPSFLLFQEGASLLAREVDPDALAYRSPPVTLAGGLPLDGIGAFSVAGGVLAYFHGPYPISRSRLVWRSRTGRTLGVLSEPDNYIYVSLSPDGRTVAADISADYADVWTIDVATGVATRQTEHPKLDRTPVWSPDGRQLLISTNRDGGGRIYVLSADGSAKAAPWLDYPADGEFSDWPSQWHSSASTVLFSRRAEAGHDIWEKQPGAAPRSLITASGSQFNARLSPGQRYIAYASDELGEWQVFLCTYSAPGSRTRISPAGGNYPIWNRDGTELYYVAPDGNIMAVEIPAEQLLKPSLPRPLFRVQFPVSPAPTVYQYAVTKDDERFLVVEEVEGPSATAVLNWEQLLDR